MLRKPSLQRSVTQHLLVFLISLAILGLFWVSRRDWSPEHRWWRATGDVSLVFLVLSLAIGPLAKLSSRFVRLNPWRREIGIWSAVWAMVHTLTILDGWLKWDWLRFMGFEFIQEINRRARTEPGFGLSNLVGLVAIVFIVVLALTSSDIALRRLGSNSWKYLHQSANIILFLSVLHTAYFLFIQYEPTFHRQPTPENWFRLPFLLLAMSLWGLQLAAFFKEVNSKKGGTPKLGGKTV